MSVVLQKSKLSATASNTDKLKAATQERKQRDAFTKGCVWADRSGASVEGRITGIVAEIDKSAAKGPAAGTPTHAMQRKKKDKKKKEPKDPAVTAHVADVIRSLGPSASMLLRSTTKYLHQPPGSVLRALKGQPPPDPAKIPMANVQVKQTNESYSDEIPMFLLGHGMGATLALCCATLEVSTICNLPESIGVHYSPINIGE